MTDAIIMIHPVSDSAIDVVGYLSVSHVTVHRSPSTVSLIAPRH
jgi:hypothetical protein